MRSCRTGDLVERGSAVASEFKPVCGAKDSGFGHLAYAKFQLGSEVDFSFIYQLSPGVIWELNAGNFSPGTFYSSKKQAVLAATRLKIGF